MWSIILGSLYASNIIHSFQNERTHTLTQLIDKTKQSNHLEQMQNIIYPPNANYLILCTRTHTHRIYVWIFVIHCHQKKKNSILVCWIIYSYITKKIIDVMVHIGDHKNQNQWVFIFSRRMKNSLIEFNGIR